MVLLKGVIIQFVQLVLKVWTYLKMERGGVGLFDANSCWAQLYQCIM